jgi:uncharacterized membrane protein YphA (DoxX/SURF4 family)
MAEDSKGRKIGYWITTGLVVLSFVGSGVGEVLGNEQAVAPFAHLGYPAYFASLLGTAKILGGVAVAVPKFPRLKEWAYAGMVIDVISAAYSHLRSGDGAQEIATPLVVLAIVLASYFLRPGDRRLPDPAQT